MMQDGKYDEDLLACRKPQSLSQQDTDKILMEYGDLDNRQAFFQLSNIPISHAAEQRMEQISFIVTKEHFGSSHWVDGSYVCASCGQPLYSSRDKFTGPCMWPSFRQACAEGALSENPVQGYNKYTCDTREIYCAKCKLFLGHMFEDGKESGDSHPEARWRHCVLSMSLCFHPA